MKKVIRIIAGAAGLASIILHIGAVNLNTDTNAWADPIILSSGGAVEQRQMRDLYAGRDPINDGVTHITVNGRYIWRVYVLENDGLKYRHALPLTKSEWQKAINAVGGL